MTHRPSPPSCGDELPGPPNDALAGPARPAARGTAWTMAGFFCCATVLAAAPGVPSFLRPLDLSTPTARSGLVARLVARPKMTLAEHEKKLEGVPEVPEETLDPEEERELQRERDGAIDLAVLSAPRAPPAAESEELPPVERAAIVARGPQRRIERHRALHAKLGMPGARIENPCVARGNVDGSEACLRTALDPLFATLDAIARGDAEARAAVVVFGNSLIASDHVTDIVRERLTERFGDAGRGYLLPERLSKVAGRRVRTGSGSDGWIVRSFAQDPPFPEGVRFGFAGSLHEASVDGETTRWDIDGAVRARLYWLDTGEPLRLDADGREVLRVPASTSPTQQPKQIEVRLPPGGKHLRLVADKGARVFGVALERDRPGVIVDTIGVPAASARLYRESTDAGAFIDQLATRDPALVVLMLGGNETRALAYGTIDEERFEDHLNGMIDRVRQAAPRAGCLLVTPIDAAKTTTSGEELVTRDEIHRVIAVERKVAAARGCALFDLFSAMGGVGSLARMRAAGFVSDDLVHPTARGGDLLGELFAQALLTSWVETAPPVDAPVFRRRRHDEGRPRFVGLSFPEEEHVTAVVVGAEEAQRRRPLPLSRFFSRLQELERGDRSRVAIGQFGASHTAGQMLTDRMRQRLGARFGVAGRGFVAVGKASKRLAPSGVVRELVGDFDIADGREVTSGGALGMAGTKAKLFPGARFRVGFCQGCAREAAAGRIELAWLYTPDMGSADVLIDGERVATLTPDVRRRESDVQFLSLPVSSERATLEVVARERPMPLARERATADADEDVSLSPVGPVHLLSVTEEMTRTGIVLDAIGLPGTTGMTPQRWRQDLYAEEVKARRYDLIVTAWGTNEAGISSLDESTYRHHFGATLRTLRGAAPEADCLIVGATDRFDKKGGTFVQAPNHDLVERVQRELAAEHGCAFYSLRDAMGGPGSMRRWVQEGLGHDDHVHFTREGYAKLADMIVDDLLAAFAWHTRQTARAQPTIAHETQETAPATARTGAAPPTTTASADAAPEG